MMRQYHPPLDGVEYATTCMVGPYQRFSPPLPRPPLLRARPDPDEFATSTFSVRPSTIWPLNFLSAGSASSAVAISTKPKPRERPVSRSVTTAADSTWPAAANTSRSRSVDVENARPPMNSFCAMGAPPLLLPRCEFMHAPEKRGRWSRGLTRRRVPVNRFPGQTTPILPNIIYEINGI